MVGWKLIVFANRGIRQEWGEELEWFPCDSAMQYVRRFNAVEKLPQSNALVDYLVNRTVGTQHMLDVDTNMKRHLAEAAANLNEDQYQAVEKVVTGHGEIMVRGSYGCGESRTISWMVKLLLECRPKDIVLVTAETNVAIDQVLLRLHEMNIPSDKIVRLGSAPETRSELREFTLDERVRKFQAQPFNLSANVARKRTLDPARVFVATLSATGNNTGLKIGWSIIINDEAAQTAEHGVLMAMRAQTSTMVLFGDPKQLLPHLNLQGPRKHKFDLRGQPHYITQSLMVAIQRQSRAFPGVTLHRQYRCHAQISALVAPFYSKHYQVITAPNVSPVSYLQGMRLRSNDVIGMERVILVDCIQELRSQGRGTDEANVIEQWVIVEYLVGIKNFLKQSPLRPERKEVHVLAAYKAQTRQLTTLVRRYEHIWKDYLTVAVRTFDSVQGDEANIVLLSLCRNNPARNVGFLNDTDSRLIVAISRAKDYIFIVRNEWTFSGCAFWSAIRDEAENGSIPCVNVTEDRSVEDVRRDLDQGPRYFT